MEKFTYYAPTEIVFGRDAELKTGELVKKYGGTRVMLLYGGQSAVRSGLLDRIIKNLTDAGLAVKTSGGVVPNPLLSTAERMRSEAVEFGADFILAVGGGSVIDTAKGVAHGTASPEHAVWDFWSGTPVKKSLPVAAVLTISAAGSETSDSAVLTNDLLEPHVKKGLNTEQNRCRFAVMDPVLTMTLPKWQIGAGAADIFMHTSERFFAAALGNHLTDEIAEGLLRDIILYGPKAVQDPQDYEAMSEMMWCGSISHVGLTGLGSAGASGTEGDWACHQLGHSLSALYNATHGASLSAVWGSWARYVCHVDPARFAEYARKVFGVTETDVKKAAEDGIRRTEAFFRSLGMPVNLTELLGHTPSAQEIADLADSVTFGRSRTVGNFMVLGYDDIARIFTLAR